MQEGQCDLGSETKQEPVPKLAYTPGDPPVARLALRVERMLPRILDRFEQVERLAAGSHSCVDSVLDLRLESLISAVLPDKLPCERNLPRIRCG